VGNGLTRRYIYDGEDLLLEYDESNTLQARYTHGPGVDEPIAMTRGSASYFYHQDGLGTVTELTDGSGTTAKSYAYDSWGNILAQTGTVENPYTYTGREFDAETGLYYYRERYYDPQTGRFLQKDPIGLRGGDFTLYAYVGNDPIDRIDPYGLYLTWVHKRITRAALANIGRRRFCGKFSNLPELVANVDFDPSWNISQDPANAHWHGLANGDEPKDQARSKFARYLDGQLKACTAEGLARALHAVQDTSSEGHWNFQSYYDGSVDISHIFSDAYPNPNNEVAGRVLSEGILGRFLESCPCTCGQ
jgi:RHS repeat-associated protein